MMALLWRSVLSTSITELVLLSKFDSSSPKFDNSSEIKRFVTWLWANDITTTWGGVANGTLSMMLICCPNSMFLASSWQEIYRFSNCSFLLNLSSSKLMFISLTLGKSQLFYRVWVWHAEKNNPIPLSLIKIQEPSEDVALFKLFSMIQSVGIKNWFSQSINRL